MGTIVYDPTELPGTTLAAYGSGQTGKSQASYGSVVPVSICDCDLTGLTGPTMDGYGSGVKQFLFG